MRTYTADDVYIMVNRVKTHIDGYLFENLLDDYRDDIIKPLNDLLRYIELNVEDLRKEDNYDHNK